MNAPYSQEAKKPIPVQIIVNADDLGISESVNEAIFRGIQRHAITSATILANGPAVEHACLGVGQHAGCSFGIHLNLMEFKPLHPASNRSLASIMSERGTFNRAIRSVPITPRLLRSIFFEWCAQIETLARLGVQITHMDSHFHVHTIPWLLPVLAALRHRYKINKIRISMNLYGVSQPHSAVLLAKKRVFNNSLSALGFRTAHVFTDLEAYWSVCKVRRPPGRLVELMVHPGADGPVEASLLDSCWINELRYPATLTSYLGI